MYTRQFKETLDNEISEYYKLYTYIQMNCLQARPRKSIYNKLSSVNTKNIGIVIVRVLVHFDSTLVFRTKYCVQTKNYLVQELLKTTKKATGAESNLQFL